MYNFKTLGLAVALLTAPVMANANAIQLKNTDGAGFVTLDKLNISSVFSTYENTVNVGADHTLNNGDTFTETIHFQTTGSNLAALGLNLKLSGDYFFDAVITGAIQNLVGTGILINPDNSLTGLNTSLFNVFFNPAINNILLSDANSGTQVANFSLTSGGASAVQLVAGTVLSDVAINATINTALGGIYQNTGTPFLRDASGNILTTDPLTVTTGSARVVGTVGNRAKDEIKITFFDNGAAQTYPVPEPTSLGLIGIGMLLISAFKRSRSNA